MTWYLCSKLLSQAKEYFDKAAENEEPGGFYNLGVMYLKGLGVKRDLKIATKYFALAANAGQPKAFYQIAKMFHTGVGLKKNLHMVRVKTRFSFLISKSMVLSHSLTALEKMLVPDWPAVPSIYFPLYIISTGGVVFPFSS